MTLRRVILLTLSCFTFAGSALQMDHALQDCDKSEFQKNTNDLIQSVNVIYQRDENGKSIERDPREKLVQGGLRAGLKKEEMPLVQANLFRFYCVQANGDIYQTSAALVGYNDILLLPAHGVLEKDGSFKKSCYYQQLRSPFKTSSIQLSNENTKVYTNDWAKDHAHDKAIVRLPREIVDTEPFDLERHAPAPVVGEKYITLTALQKGLSDQFSQRDIIVQSSSARDVFAQNSKHPAIIFTDATMMEGSCGGVNLIRNDQGKLVVRSIEVGGGKDNRPPQEYNLADKSFTYSLAVDDSLIQDIRKLSHDRKATLDQDSK